MPTAATLLAAINGKPIPTPGVVTNGGNVIAGVNPAAQYNPGADIQSQTQAAQSAYQAQQNANRSNLFASLAPASVGGGTTSPNVQSPQNDPLNVFQQRIGTITQTGNDATVAAQNDAIKRFNDKLTSMGTTYKANLITNQQPYSTDQLNSMLGSNYAGQLPAGTDPNSPGARAVAIAKQSLGVNYVYGGNSLTQGVDCSGLVQQVYGRLGIRLPRTSTEQAKYGKIVPSLQQALPGDLILMYSPYEPAGLQQFGHVGIYIGNGMMIDAPHTGAKVRIERISNMTRIVRPW